ncbi:MAG TPA: hypothetical protein VF719_10180 [Abditibacteriaceae bacterium]|jgi:hypothetical protein
MKLKKLPPFLLLCGLLFSGAVARAANEPTLAQSLELIRQTVNDSGRTVEALGANGVMHSVFTVTETTSESLNVSEERTLDLFDNGQTTVFLYHYVLPLRSLKKIETRKRNGGRGDIFVTQLWTADGAVTFSRTNEGKTGQGQKDNLVVRLANERSNDVLRTAFQQVLKLLKK